jgi:excisionase family DNA binding protein
MRRRKKAATAPLKPVMFRGQTSKPRFLTIDQTCEYGGFSRTKAYALIKEGKITAKKLGTRVLIDRASFDRFLDTLPQFAS